MPFVLVYHGTLTLHAEPGGGERMAAVRFGTPVRLSSLRIAPEGVEGPGGSVAGTTPGEFTLDVLLNVSPSEPVNALARTSVRVANATHALEYPLDMPEGTTTRLVIFRAPAQSITLSLYAHGSGDSPTGAECVPESADLPRATPLNLPTADTLLASLPSLEGEQRIRALNTLVVLARSELDLATMLATPAAASLANAPEGDTHNDDELATDAAVASVLGLDPGSDVPLRPALRALLALPGAPWATEYPHTEAPLSIAMRLAEAQRSSGHPRAGAALATTLGRLLSVLDSATPSGPTLSMFARCLPPLAAAAMTLGHPVDLPTTLDARAVLSALLASSAETTHGGRACGPSAAALASPFLPFLPPDDALRRAWDTSSISAGARCPPSSIFSATPSPLPVTGSLPMSPNPAVPMLQVDPPTTVPTSAPGMPLPAQPPARINPHMVARMTRALDAGSHSLDLSPTPAELLAAVAPDLLASLSTARSPPLGIPASRAAHGSASDYAGKVYSAHEFRRERETVSGLGVGASSAGRKASRHVDDFRS